MQRTTFQRTSGKLSCCVLSQQSCRQQHILYLCCLFYYASSVTAIQEFADSCSDVLQHPFSYCTWLGKTCGFASLGSSTHSPKIKSYEMARIVYRLFCHWRQDLMKLLTVVFVEAVVSDATHYFLY